MKYYHAVLNYLLQLRTNRADLWKGSELGYKQEEARAPPLAPAAGRHGEPVTGYFF